MKVKIGDRTYDGDVEPIMIILSDADKENITNMNVSCTKYCVYPDDYQGDIDEFMELRREA